MKFAFIAASEVAFPVSAMCRVLGVPQRLLRLDEAAEASESQAGRSARRQSRGGARAQPAYIRQPARSPGASGSGCTSRQETSCPFDAGKRHQRPF